MTVKWKLSLQACAKKSLIYSALPLYFLLPASAQNSEDAPTEHIARDPNLGRTNSADSYSPPYKFESFKRSHGVKTETTIVRDKKDLFNCAAEECLFSLWAGPKYIFTTGGLRSTYAQNTIPVVTFGAEKPFHRLQEGTFLTFGISIDYFAYSSKALGANLSSSVTDQTSNNDALYNYANILPYFGIEHYTCPHLSFFFNAGPELQYRSLVIQNSTSTQPSDYIVSTTVGIGAEAGARVIMPITTGFNFFLRPAVGVNIGPSINKNLVFQSVAGQNQAVDINPVTYSAALSAGGEF